MSIQNNSEPLAAGQTAFLIFIWASVAIISAVSVFSIVQAIAGNREAISYSPHALTTISVAAIMSLPLADIYYRNFRKRAVPSRFQKLAPLILFSLPVSALLSSVIIAPSLATHLTNSGYQKCEYEASTTPLIRFFIKQWAHTEIGCEGVLEEVKNSNSD